MTSVQERLKLKRAACDVWSIREQLCLASSVLKSGDQNWMSVSRSIKPLLEKEGLRPADWFSQKSCAIQYAHLLENADTPKRKKRESGETTSESIVRRLTQERITELGQIMNLQRDEYRQLKAEVNMLKSASISDEKLQKMLLSIEQEDRELEQKAKAHLAWIAKRQQQKQEAGSPLPVPIATQQKHTETPVESQQQTESVDEEEKKSRGGRSPLLTSLLKSPSPTTQIQTITQPIQVSSPTITSLLGSSPKVPNAQLTQNVPSQLHPMVSPAAATTQSERPSACAPTLSMLLEMPANTQRGPLPNLQSTSTIVPQQTIPAEVHTLPTQTVQQPAIQPDASTSLTMNTSTNIPVTESMVQIIDHLDNVIRKDIMTEVMDKDEINEIIDDIEELIKEEITGSPQTTETTSSTLTAITVPPVPEVPVIQERPEPRNVDDAVSLSNSPQSEMAIEEIDSSTSNIAEIIGTVAIEPQEPKAIVAEVTETVPNIPQESKSETTTPDETVTVKEELAPKVEAEEAVSEEVLEEKQIAEAVESLETPVSASAEKPDLKSVDIKEPAEDTAKEQIVKPEETEVIEPEVKDNRNEIKEQADSSEELENEDNEELDQLELHLAKITGEPQDVPSADVASVSSEVTNDLPSTEDTEKSQDISLILEDDESTHSSEKRKTVPEHDVIENAAESAESMESFKEETGDIAEEKTPVEIKDTTSTKTQPESTSEEQEVCANDFKKEEAKDSSEDTASAVLEDIKVKEEIVEEPIEESVAAQTSSQETEAVKKESVEPSQTETDTVVTKKEQDISVPTKVEEQKVEEEPKPRQESKVQEEAKKEEPQVKEEKAEKKADNEQVKKEVEATISTGEETAELEEEETSLTKLSAGRAMKTYPSKKQSTLVDSETETEGTGEGADYRAWKKAVMLVYNRLATHKYASIFLRPITEDQAPGYHSVIFRPMDLSTIKKNIDNGTIRSTMHFQRDVMLMFQNAIMYNKHDTFIYKMAVSMQEECLQHMQILVQVTGEGTLKRETRTATSGSSEIGDNTIKRKRSHITPSPHDTESPRSKKRRKSEND